MYKRPKTMKELPQASSLKTETILAGGTDLVPLIKNGVKNCSSLIDITQIPELKKIEKTRIKVGKRGKISKNIGGIQNEIFSGNKRIR